MEPVDVAVGFLIGTLFVYGVGIAVPALVRFVFYKKPMTKGSAIGLLVIWWFILFTMIYFMKSGTPPKAVPLIVVVVISYGILTKKDKSAETTSEGDKKQIKS